MLAITSLLPPFSFHNFQDILPRWQTAASDLIVSVGKKFKHEVMSELLENLVPGTLPHYFVILTLANFAQADGKSKSGKCIGGLTMLCTRVHPGYNWTLYYEFGMKWTLCI